MDAAECYMCNAVAVDREHVPPQSFFPEGYRRDLFTVPSCAEHNAKNSKDVEYVRNLISGQHGTNAVAAKVFETTKRSYDRSPRLMTQTFQELTQVQVGGEETAAFPVDLSRLNTVMKAVTYALYFRDHGHRWLGDWRVFTPSLGYAEALYSGKPDPWQQFKTYLNRPDQFIPMAVPVPEVFKYGVIEEASNVIYRFEFYEGFIVNAWTRSNTSPLIAAKSASDR